MVFVWRRKNWHHHLFDVSTASKLLLFLRCKNLYFRYEISEKLTMCVAGHIKFLSYFIVKTASA